MDGNCHNQGSSLFRSSRQSSETRLQSNCIEKETEAQRGLVTG